MILLQVSKWLPVNNVTMYVKIPNNQAVFLAQLLL